MKRLKTVFGAVLNAALLLTVLHITVWSAPAANSVNVTINGLPVAYSDQYGYPYIDSADRTQVPFRLTMETFGCTVNWDQATQTAITSRDGVTVKVPIGKAYIEINGARKNIDTVSVLSNGRTYLPIRAVLEAFGATVSWDGSSRTVVVTTPGGGSVTRVHFLDVGQGDAILIDCGQVEVLIDGGDNKAGSTVVSALRPLVDGKLDYIIATHPDADHIGGLDDVLAAFEVGEVIDSGRSATSATYKDYMTAVQNEPGCTLSYDEDRTIILGPNTILSIIETGDNWSNANDSSVVSELICGDVTVLFTGDISQKVEQECLSLFGDVDVLKVGHHGSATSSSAAFLKVVKPEVAVASYKVGNSYRHPTASALQRLFDCGATVYGTGKSGTIVMTTDGSTYSFNTSTPLTLADAGA